jgi:hypothetical protein
MKAWGYSDEKIAKMIETERLKELELEEYLKTHPKAKMLDILEML